MDQSDKLSDNLKIAVEKFNKGMKDMKPMINMIDSIVEYFETMDEKLTPIYEKFKKVNDICDKVDLIDKTMLRISKYHSMSQKSDKEPYLNLFQYFS